jgi:hypothetical protein
MQRWFVPHHLSELALQLAIAGLVYGISMAWAFWTKRAWETGQIGAVREDEVTLAVVEAYEKEA